MNNDQPCSELVQLITDYLDGALPPSRMADVAGHLEGCEGCRNAMAQWRSVIALTGRLTEAEVRNTDELTRDRIRSLCRGPRRR